jgi:Lrp/AsnC family leucine-responsive transcriptional regulator
MDEIDRRILSVLQADGRVSFRDLGKRVHLSPNATAERVRHLQATKVIRGIHADIDFAQLGLSLQAYVDVRLRPGTGARATEAAVLKIPGVIGATILTGAFDCRVRVACRDQRDLMRLIEALRASPVVLETNSAVILHEIEVARGNPTLFPS